MLGDLGHNPATYYEKASRALREALDYSTTPDQEYTARGLLLDVLPKLAQEGGDPIGHVGEALNHGARALELARISGHIERVGDVLLGQAIAEGILALYVPDSERLQRATTLARKAQTCFRENSDACAAALDAEANIRSRMAALGINATDNLQQACELYGQALSVCRDPLRRACTTLNRGTALWRLGTAGMAPAETLQRAIRDFSEARKGFAEGSADYALALMGEGACMVYSAIYTSAPNRALRSAMILLEEAIKHLPSGSVDASRASLYLAMSLALDGRLTEARERLDEGVRTTEAVLSHIRGEDARAAYHQMVLDWLALAVRLSLDEAHAAERSGHADAAERLRREAWHWAHRAKSRNLLYLLRSHRLGPNPAWIQDWADNELRIRKAHNDSPGPNDGSERRTGHYSADLLKLIAQQRTIVSRIADQDIPDAMPVPTPEQVMRDLIAMAAVPQADDHRTLVAEFTVLNDAEAVLFLTPLWDHGRLETHRIAAPGGSFAQLAGRLAASIDAIRSARNKAEPQAIRNSHDAMAAVLDEMSQIVAPIAPMLRTHRPTNLVLAPSHPLNNLPLHAANMDGAPLIEHLPVSYIPSASLASEIAARRTPRNASRMGLIVTDPFDDGDSTFLPGARMESEAAHRTLSELGLDVISLSGQAASAAAVLAHISKAAVIHIISHSQIDAGLFLRSGIELADRRLTVLDILGTTMGPAWVYLSSCQSSQQVERRTDDLVAIVRAFLAAGAPSVIGTLWDVDSEAAARMSAEFHRSLRGSSESLAHAIREAVMSVRRDSPQPFFWAPVVLHGACTLPTITQ
jgi:tetratricopeptide (TPR) repeat protein